MPLFTTTLTSGPDTLVFTGVDLFDIPWTIEALGGNDSITINAGTITSGGGDWTICYLGDGDDLVRVNGGHSVQVHGDSGNDQADLYSSAFFDGGLGNDTLNVFGGTHAGMNGGPGADTVNFNADIAADILGGDDDDLFFGNDHVVSGSISGGDGNDSFFNIRAPTGSSLTLIGGPGDDSFRGSLSQMNGVSIADFAPGDSIWLLGANPDLFEFSLSGNTLTYTGGSLTFGSPLNGTLGAIVIGGRAILRLIGGNTNEDAANDFNGDGRSDILLRNNGGTLTDWLGTSTGGFTQNAANLLLAVATDWHIATTGDFNGDRRDDILWRNDDGRISNWLGTSSGGFTDNVANAYNAVSTDWQVAGIGDFNGDGRDDILWHNNDGRITNWLGTTAGGFLDNVSNAYNSVPTDWQVAGIGDFNGDGRDDILWRNNDGRITNWLGTTAGGFIDNVSNAYNSVSTDWQVAGIGDFNGDERDDILWRNSDGRITDWLGTESGGYAPNFANAHVAVATDWQVAAVGDYNGDDLDDILWRNADGRITNWLGTAPGGFSDNFANAYAAVDIQWQIQPNPSGAGNWDY